jgi:transcriptional regulator with XRE-family HTH domain
MFNGRELQRLRQARSITREALAEKLANGATHPTAQSIEHWESGYTFPTLELVEQLCEIFEVPALRFFAVDGITLPRQLLADVIECLGCCEPDKALGMLLGALTMLGMAPFDANEIADRCDHVEVEPVEPDPFALNSLGVGGSKLVERDGEAYRVTRQESDLYEWLMLRPLDDLDDDGESQ